MNEHPDVIRLLRRVEVAGKLALKESTVERLGLKDALRVCLAESLLERVPAAGATDSDQPRRYRLTKKGKADQARRRMGIGATEVKSGEMPETDIKSVRPDTAPANPVSLDAQAVGVFLEHPDWTKKRIAKQLGCHAKSLTPKRCPRLATAMAASKAKIDPGTTRRGSKDAAGNLEAWEEDE